MSSAEGDLGALDALEEKEQKEFLAFSQNNLFNPPSPPAAGKVLPQTQQLKQQQLQQKLANAQLYPHILKLPTISECNLIAAARRRQLLFQQQQQQNAGSNTENRRLKFTRALSLSAHSLSGRGNVNGKKALNPKPRTSSSHVSISGSPSFPYSSSPVYTPPPVRRCATLHHTQPVRKAFKTLQQLEKQKHDRKKEGVPTLRRISGTNKTYWKYGVNSTAASIIGQRKKLNSSIAEIESNTSDELGSEATNDISGNGSHSNSEQWPKSYVDCDDSVTDPGSCSVPLASDSVEIMRLMLSAATAAVTTHPLTTQTEARAAKYVPKDVDYLLNGRPFDVARPINKAATSGAACKPIKAVNTPKPTSTNKLNGEKSILQSCYGSTFLGLPSRYHLKLSTASFSPEKETVAFKAFSEQWRRKSFSNNSGRVVAKLRRGCSLTDNNTAHNSSCNSNSYWRSPKKSRIFAGKINNCKMLKTSSLDMNIEFDTRLNIEGDTSTSKQSTFKNNHISEGNETTTSAATKKINTNFVKELKNYHQLNLHGTVAEAHFPPLISSKMELPNSHKNCSGLSKSTENIKGLVISLHHQHIDDELEQHIKHCSCSCNHMGYGNSMDYQTTGFGGLPDVTEHSNARRTLSHQNSISNSDSGGEIASIEKSKGNFGDIRPPPLAHPANIKRKSKAAHQAVNDSCARVNHFKLRLCSCGIFLTLVAALCLLTIAAMLAYQHFMAPSRNSHAQRLRIVRRILKEVPLVDGHNNFAWNVRKYAQNSLEFVHTRQDPNAATLWTRPAWAQTDMERLKQGLVGAQMWSAYVPCEALGLDAVQIAIEQIDIIRRLTDMFNLDTVLVSSAADILTARKHDQMASLIAIKGGHAIGSSLAVLRSFYSVGARALSLTHRCDLSWASSSASDSENGLSAFGKSVIREMNRLGMMVDLSYSSDATARDVLHVTRAPVIFSHSAARQLCNSTHNIPDDILRLVADNGGLIMVSFDPEDVACGQQAYISDVVQHIKYIRAIAGVQHVGLGAGYDGIEIPPVGLEDVSKYPELLATLLQDHNWSEQDIAMLAGKNFLRILETVENVRDYWKRADIQPLEQTEPQPKPHCQHKSS
ncbi:uncharacterized protein [Eurosta solidaginis]|uniref:uncharacterized protein isoform X1 n=1 Tax=Eurosta solidaginis TaxID=178769 RepID=UPI0035314B2E